MRKGNCAWCTGSFEGLGHVYSPRAFKDLEFCTIDCLEDYEEYQHGHKRSRWYLAAAGILGLFILVYATTPKAQAHEHYSDWKVPGTNGSCCNERVEKDGTETGDCEIAPFEVRQDNEGNVDWYVYIRQVKRWQKVPEQTLLREKNPDPAGIDGHVCWTLPKGVICARPPTGAL